MCRLEGDGVCAKSVRPERQTFARLQNPYDDRAIFALAVALSVRRRSKTARTKDNAYDGLIKAIAHANNSRTGSSPSPTVMGRPEGDMAGFSISIPAANAMLA